MKKRNKYFEKEKQYLKLENDLSVNSKAQSALGYIELDVPIHYGYYSTLVLRKDVSNREDSWVFQNIITKFGERRWWRKNYKKFPPKNEDDSNRFPRIKSISERDYIALPAQIKKWFSEFTIRNNKFYYCNVPNFYFEVKVDKHYKTHYKILDEVLLQEEAELEAEYYSAKYRGIRRRCHGAPKGYVRLFNVSYRRESKRITKHNFSLLDENDNLEYSLTGRHTADWAWW